MIANALNGVAAPLMESNAPHSSSSKSIAQKRFVDPVNDATVSNV
jgi:hypothetical protein